MTTGEIVASIALVLNAAGVSYAVWRGSKELERWRAQRREDQQAEAAGRALVATLTFLSQLSRLAATPNANAYPDMLASNEWDPSVGPEENAKKLSDVRWGILRESGAKPAFDDAWVRAAIFLPDRSFAVMGEVLGLYGKISLEHERCWNEPEFGSEVYQEITDMETRVLVVLGPLARMEATPGTIVRSERAIVDPTRSD